MIVLQGQSVSNTVTSHAYSLIQPVYSAFITELRPELLHSASALTVSQAANIA